MSTQQMFNDSVLGIVKQGKPAFDTEANACRNLTSDGLRCAVGVLIPPNRYEPNSEGMHPDTIYRRYLSDLYPAADSEILCRLRRQHDLYSKDGDAIFLRRFIGAARDIARHFNLTFPEAEVAAAIANVKAW